MRLEELVMAPDVHGSGLLSGGKDSGWFGRCTRFSAQVPLQAQHPASGTGTRRIQQPMCRSACT